MIEGRDPQDEDGPVYTECRVLPDTCDVLSITDQTVCVYRSRCA